MENYRITNTSKNSRCSCEVYFSTMPEKATREALKREGFRWHNAKKCWYGYTDTTTAAAIISAAEEDAAPLRDGEKAPKTEKPAKVNKYGVKVGDWFYMSWGYEQTNADFFQVVALVGESSVRIRQAQPEMVKEDGISGMSADRYYKLTSEILPACSSVFIKDNERGDLKRLKSYAADGVSNPQIYMASYADAHYLGNSGIKKCYESWYY